MRFVLFLFCISTLPWLWKKFFVTKIKYQAYHELNHDAIDGTYRTLFCFYYNRKEYLLKQRQGTISQSLQFNKTPHFNNELTILGLGPIPML